MELKHTIGSFKANKFTFTVDMPIQWNLRIKGTSGHALLSFVEKLSLCMELELAWHGGMAGKGDITGTRRVHT